MLQKNDVKTKKKQCKNIAKSQKLHPHGLHVIDSSVSGI